MNDETVVSETEVQDTVPVELPAEAVETSSAASDDGSVTETETITVVDYTPVIYEVGNGITLAMVWCTFLIVGVLIAFKIMEVKR